MIVLRLLDGDAEFVLALAWLGFGDQHEAAWICIRQRLQEHGVKEAEDRGVGADAEGQSEHGGGHEAGRAAKLAQGELEVLQERFKRR